MYRWVLSLFVRWHRNLVTSACFRRRSRSGETAECFGQARSQHLCPRTDAVIWHIKHSRHSCSPWSEFCILNHFCFTLTALLNLFYYRNKNLSLLLVLSRCKGSMKKGCWIYLEGWSLFQHHLLWQLPLIWLSSSQQLIGDDPKSRWYMGFFLHLSHIHMPIQCLLNLNKR